MMGALEGTKFEAFGATVAQSSTYFEAAAGASDLYAASASSAGGATKVWTVIQGAFNAVMALNPVVLVVIAIVALVAIIIVAYKNCETFRKIVDAAFKVALTVIRAVYTWVKTNWPLLLAILTGPIGLAVIAISKNFDTIKGAIQTVIDLIKNILGRAVRTHEDGRQDRPGPDADPDPGGARRLPVDHRQGRIADRLARKIKIPSTSAGLDPSKFAARPPPRWPVPARRCRWPAVGVPSGHRAGGGVVINLSVPATANPVETGRQIVSMIRRFERAAGPAWRS